MITLGNPYHTHLNSTKWTSLGEFAKNLEESGIFETEVRL